MYKWISDYLKNFYRWQYVVVLGIANTASIAKMFIYAKVIPVEEFGVYATLMLISSFYVVVGSLGWITELQRMFPVYFRNGDTRSILIGVFQILLVSGFILLLASLICLTGVRFVTLSGAALFTGFLGGFAQLLFSVVTNETRARLLLQKYSNEIMLRNLIILVAGTGCAILIPHGYWVFLLETILTLAIAIGLHARFISPIRKEGVTFLLRSALESLKSYKWSPVLAMMIIGLLTFFMQYGERYVSKTYLSIEDFAILSFGLIIPNVANTMQAILNNSIFTNQVLRFHDFGRAGVVRYSLIISSKFLLLFTVLAVPGYFAFSEVVRQFYPAYTSILPYLPIVFLAFIFRSSDFVSNIYVIINKPQIYAFIQLAYLLVIAVAIIWSRHLQIFELSNPVFYFLLNLFNAVIPIIVILLLNWGFKNPDVKS